MDYQVSLKLAKQREELFKKHGIDQKGLELLQDYDHDKEPKKNINIKNQSLLCITELTKELYEDDSSGEDQSESFSDSSDEQDSQLPADKRQPMPIVKIKKLSDTEICYNQAVNQGLNEANWARKSDKEHRKDMSNSSYNSETNDNVEENLSCTSISLISQQMKTKFESINRTRQMTTSG